MISPARRWALSKGEAPAAPAAMLAERSIKSDDLPLASQRLGGLPVRSREQEGKQEHAGGPQGQEDPAPDLPPAGLIAEHHPQEVERPDLDPPRPLAKQQVDHDRHGHRRSGRQEPQMDEAQSPQWRLAIRISKVGNVSSNIRRGLARAAGRWSRVTRSISRPRQPASSSVCQAAMAAV